MSTEFVASLGPNDFMRETTLGSDPELVLVSAGDVRGVSLPKFILSNNKVFGYIALFRIPLNLTMGTGLTFTLYLKDDGSDASDLGKKVYIGLTVKRMIADETTDIDVGGSTEVLTEETLSTTAGGLKVAAIALTSIDSLAVGELCMLRVRRKGSDTTHDTCPGRVILLRCDVANT